jgi:hypothetical protein
MNHLHAQRKQDGYKVTEAEQVANHKSLIGLSYVAESKRGKVIKSSWTGEILEDGTEFRLNTRIRETENFGKVSRKTDRTLIVRHIGTVIAGMVSESGNCILHTSIGTICMLCRTSDHIKWTEDNSGCTCTRCGKYSKAE